ncbi:MAG: HAD-IC family P-type ATPase [Chloroflexota bacterium]|nr:HAD-IC family P-type ATPase [Chloroflexota bacterium]
MDRDSGGAQGTQSAFDAAFAAYIPAAIARQAGALTIVKELPFDPADRRRRVILADSAHGLAYLVVIGSAETLLQIAHCSLAQQYRDQVAAEGQQGLRHLAIAYKHLTSPETTDILAQEKDVTFLGFVTLADPLRASTAHTIATAQTLGVAIKILTGDSKEVAAYVARQVGLLPDGGTVYTGDDLAALSPADLTHAVTTCNVFARVSPEQKFAIITALKAQAVVGYQGDGINDAPSLKLADVGIAVDAATEVAKANADIILLDKDLGVIINAITYGRTIFANINKYIKYTMVGNFGNFFALALLYLLSANLPLLPRQVLLISLLTDLPLIAISTDTVSGDELEQPDRYSARALLSISLVLGTLTALFELAFFLTLRGQIASASQTSLYLFFSFTQLIVILSIRNRDHFWKAVAPSRPLLGALALTGVLALALPYVQPIARLFSFSAPPLSEVGVVLAMTVLYVLALDVVKVRYYKLVESPRSPRWLSRRTPVAVAPTPVRRTTAGTHA